MKTKKRFAIYSVNRLNERTENAIKETNSQLLAMNFADKLKKNNKGGYWCGVVVVDNQLNIDCYNI